MPGKIWVLAVLATMATMHVVVSARSLPDFYKGACLSIHKIQHGTVSCTYRGCLLTCAPHHHISTTRRPTAWLRCHHKTNVLRFRGAPWKEQMTLCTPSPPAAKSLGEPMLGDQPYQGYQPDGPLRKNERRVVCKGDDRMPGGATSVTLHYKDNLWFFPDGKVLLGVDQVTCAPEKSPPSSPPRTGKGLLALRARDTQFAPHPDTCQYPRFTPPLDATVTPQGARMVTLACRSDVTKHVSALCKTGVWRTLSGKMLMRTDLRC